VQTPELLNAEVIQVMEPPFPAVAAEDAVSEAVALLSGERQRCSSPSTAAPRDRHPRRPARGARAMSAPPRTERASPPARCTPAWIPDPTYRSVIPAIHQTSTFRQPGVGRFVEDFDYARSANPTRSALEAALGELEGGRATALASGMAATHALLTAVCGAGDHVVLPADLYGGTFRLVDKVLARWGCRTPWSTRPTWTRWSAPSATTRA
jgi:cystathionine beta-lyase/cystathionine gamma-synthase